MSAAQIRSLLHTSVDQPSNIAAQKLAMARDPLMAAILQCPYDAGGNKIDLEFFK
jgi:hypothetical protein